MISRPHVLLCLFGTVAYFLTIIVGNEAIAGGKIAENDQFPYQVSLFYDGQINACGGGIIGNKQILTAAHCVISPNGQVFHNKLFVLAATSNLYKRNEPALYVQVARIFVPKEFNYFVNGTRGDIAVLELKDPLELSKNQAHMRKLKLPKNQQDNHAGNIATITGFGWNWIRFEGSKEHGNNTDGYLRFLHADVLSNSNCQLMTSNLQLSDKDLCAKAEQPNNARYGVCNRDSGSPLVVNDTTVIGILSRSPRSCSEKIKPAIYTRVSHYKAFVERALKGKKNDDMDIHELLESHQLD